MADLIYTLDSINPDAVTNRYDDLAQVKSYLDLRVRLTQDGVNILNLTILSIVRFLVDLYGAGNNKAKIDKLIRNEFHNSNIESITDNDSLYLVERRLNTSSLDEFKEINHWTADVRYIKTILVRRLWHCGLNAEDMTVLLDHYKLHDYYQNVTIGGVDEAEKMTFVMGYNHYLYEFYMRNEVVEQELVDKYKERSEVASSCLVYSNELDPLDIRLSLSLNKTCEQVMADIDEFSNNIKYYVKRLYNINHIEDAYMSICKGGKGHYRFQFRKWDRCIRVFDLYVEYQAQGKIMTDPRIDSIGKKIVKEFDVYANYEVADRRKNIVEDYNEALKLIKKSTLGYLV